eukprot:1142473-Pelagomonas_calceolata.AAC.3
MSPVESVHLRNQDKMQLGEGVERARSGMQSDEEPKLGPSVMSPTERARKRLHRWVSKGNQDAGCNDVRATRMPMM